MMHPTASADGVEIRRSTAADLTALQTLWQEVFGDPPAFTKQFYDTFGVDCAIIAQIQGKIVAMIHTLPVALAECGQYSFGVYLYALATAPAYRRQGIASALLSYAESSPFVTPPTLAGAETVGLQNTPAQSHTHAQTSAPANTLPSALTPAFALLIPGEESLFAYYRKKGYTQTAPITSKDAPDYFAHLRQGLSSTPVFLKPQPFYTLSMQIPASDPPPVQTALWKAISINPPCVSPILSHFMQ